MSIELSVIIPLYGFQPQREEAFQNLLRQIDAQDMKLLVNGTLTEQRRFEVIVVEQDCEEQMNSAPPHHSISSRPYLKHIVLPQQPGKGFNKSWCMNVAAKAAACDNLVFLDVDMIFDKTYFDKIRRFKQPSMVYFTCWQYIVTMPGKDNPVARVITKDILTAGGAFFIDRRFFWQTGGMNENYFGYGGEDNDLWVRVNRLLGDRKTHNIHSMPYALAHWYHDWAAPSPDRFYPLNRTNQFTNEIISRLKAASLGNPSHPTPIDISDLKLVEAGMEEANGKGLRD